METDAWQPEFSAKPLPSGRFAPLVLLTRQSGQGARESSMTYVGDYATAAEAEAAARRLYGLNGPS